MNTYYELIKHLKTVFEEDTHVSNVVTGDWEEWKKDVFCLVHIDVISSGFIGKANLGVTRYDVLISVMDIRDVNKEENKDRFWHNDNRHDNWNTTRAILKRAENKLIKGHLDSSIRYVSGTEAIKQNWVYMNGLDGWEQTWTIDVPDTLSTICSD